MESKKSINLRLQSSSVIFYVRRIISKHVNRSCVCGAAQPELKGSRIQVDKILKD